jgi:HPt (histidine-containing phosphotransfer) domain-containing protein
MDAFTEIDNQVFNALKAEVGADFMLELIETYCEDVHQQLHTLQTALDQGDALSFTRAAHSLKSTSLSLGALSFGNLARELEMMGREVRLADASETYQQMQSVCEPLLRKLKDLCHDQ